ncbi:MAG TPA: hypothetical protein VLV89_12830 [Candidatus Acidoferrum sp.]|nr:hypothetical protein [Candidatus Acidoferrum sp.]
MGAEIQCMVKFGKQRGEGRALLETSEILFRGSFRLKIPLAEIKAVKAANGKLRVRFGGGEAIFELGAAAEKWAEKILHPKSVIEKIGVKPGAKAVVIGVQDADFLKKLRAVAECSEKVGRGCELIFFGAESGAELKRVRLLAKSLAPAGALWIVYPKGRKEITEVGVIHAGRAAGLKDVKVVGFSASHTALKFVIPVSER